MSMLAEAPLKSAVPPAQGLIDFVVREARLIDQQRFDEWLDMYADDAFYWMPLEWNQTDPRLTCSLMYEDKLLLSIRVERLKGAAKLRPDSKMIVSREWPTGEARLNGALQISRGLMRVVAAGTPDRAARGRVVPSPAP